MANGDDNIPDSPWKRALAATGGFFMGGGLGGGSTEDSQQPQEVPANVKASNRIDDTPAPAKRGGSPQPMSQVDSYPNTEHPFNPAVYPLEQQIEQERGQYQKLAAPPPKPSLAQRIGQVLTSAGTGYMGGAPALQQQAELEQRGALAKQQERQNLAQRIDENQRAVASEGMATQRMQEQERLRAMEEQANWDRMQATLTGRMQQIGAQQEGATERTGMQQTGAMGRTQLQQQSALDRLKQTQQYGIWKTNQDNATKMRVAELTAGKAPAALVQTAVFARGGLSQMADAQQAMQQLQQSGAMGSLPANWVENWLFGNGMVDPRLDPQTRQAIGRLRAALTYTSSAAMRAHTGRTSQEIYEDFKKGLGPGQDWDALRGAMEETGNMLGQYADAASGANMNAIRSGQPSPTAPAQTPARTQGRVIRID